MESLEQRALLTLLGSEFTVRNTFQSNLGTGGTEVDNGDPVTATASDADPELTSFAGQYDINVTANSIELEFNHDPASGADPSGTQADGTFDRYYFDFVLPTNHFLTAVAVSPTSVLQPTVTVLDDDSLVVEIGPGSVIGNGQDVLIDVGTSVRGSDVSGRIWQDINNDGIRNPNEGWLNGFEVELQTPTGEFLERTVSQDIDLNSDGQIDPATERGVYLFQSVQTGSYRVAQTPRAQWVQTSPVESGGSDPALIQLRNDLGLVPSDNEFFNYAGLQEKWLPSESGTWYYITPDGVLTEWDGTSTIANLMGTAVTTLPVEVYNDPSLLTAAAPPATQTIDVVNFDPAAGPDFGNYIAPPESWGIGSLNFETNTVDFIWHPAEILPVGSIQIWISDLGANQQLDLVSGLTGEAYTRSGFADGRYRAWARIEYEAGVFSAWTRAVDFEFQRDALVLPFNSGLNAGIDGTPTVGWAAVPGAVSYDLAIEEIRDSEGNIISPAYSAYGVTGTSHRIAAQRILGVHQIRLRANFADGSRTPFSATQPLIVSGRPTVSVSGNVISWDAVQAATQYEVWVDSIDAAGQRITRQFYYEPDVHSLSYTLPGTPPRGRYSVWVRAIRAEDGLRMPSYWSAPVVFQVASHTDEQIELLPEALLTRFETDDAIADRQDVLPAGRPTPTRPETPAGEHTPAATASTDERELLQVMQEIAAGELLDAAS
ncbi:MAG: hypothetical protein NXI04_02355 [Planctomycetaceae bacterium]|nr:hypothetical protein [Planctomycetaceae bacterium]